MELEKRVAELEKRVTQLGQLVKKLDQASMPIEAWAANYNKYIV